MKKVLIALFALVVFVGVFILTAPKKSDHLDVLKQSVIDNTVTLLEIPLERIQDSPSFYALDDVLTSSVIFKNKFMFSQAFYDGSVVSWGILGHVFLNKNVDLVITGNHSIGAYKPVEVVQSAFFSADGIVLKEGNAIKELDAKSFLEMLNRLMHMPKPERNQYQYETDYSADLERWTNDPIYGWYNKNTGINGFRYDREDSGIRIYTTLDTRYQKHAMAALYEVMPDLQAAFEQERSQNKMFPFVQYTPASQREMILSHSRRWSALYRRLKGEGASDQEISEAFQKPVGTSVFSWKEGKPVSVTMSPDEEILYNLSLMRSGLMAMSPSSGAVLAYVGEAMTGDYTDNISLVNHSLGTAIQPFIYAEALESSITPCTTFINTPVMFRVSGEDWSSSYTIEEKDAALGKNVTLKWGLSQSSNNLCGILVQDSTPKAEVDFLYKFHIRCPEASPTLSVGMLDTRVSDILPAFNVFANKGSYVRPLYVTRIEDKDGGVLYKSSPTQESVIREINAHYMLDMLMASADNGTSSNLRSQYGIIGEVATKTGSTDEEECSLFLGSVPKLTVGVWTGWDNPYIHYSTKGKGLSAVTSLPVWALFIKKCQEDPSVPISSKDTFDRHPDARIVPCTGGDQDVTDDYL